MIPAYRVTISYLPAGAEHAFELTVLSIAVSAPIRTINNTHVINLIPTR